MFTGLVQKIGTVKRISRGSGTVLEIAFDPWSSPLEEGESVAVNGVCLTVAKRDAARFTADVLKETEMRSTLSSLIPGDKVNLERALRAGDRLGGHIVQGHVDGRAKVLALETKGRDRRMRISVGRVIAAQCVLKGSVAVDGVSLTITELGEDFISVDLIPTTLEETVLKFRKVGSLVNIESDVVGKYAVKNDAKKTSLTMEALSLAGFI
jgi:riboflavin synthase